MKTFEQFNIKIPSGATGNVKVICPGCTPHDRKPKNRNSKDLSVNITGGIWNCHNCGWHGTLKSFEKEYTKPVVIDLPLSEKAIGWFKTRAINENTLKFFGITGETNFNSYWILFPYRRNNEWVNVKKRNAEKKFMLTGGAELIMYNVDAIAGQKKVIITEGEIDCMTLHEIGFFACCSVPNGATKGNQRLEYLDNSWLAFSEADDIILATDNDEAGIALKNELARRLGKDRCREVFYPDGCKDFNEVIVKYGAQKVWDVINRSKPLPVEGVYRLVDFVGELDNVYENGFAPGVTLGYPDFDRLLNFSVGQLTMITGVPNSGKSAFVDQMLERLARVHKWNIGVCSFENQPMTRHAANLSSVFVGKSFFRHESKMNVHEYTAAKAFLQEYFFWFKMKDEDLSLEGILSRAKQLVKAHGIKVLVIDPYNYMEHKRPNNMSETEYVSQMLTELCNFCKDYDVHTFMVAHPTKIKKNLVTKDFEVPNLYDISGSANFFNKTDNGLTVYRDRNTDIVTVYVQKVRFFFNGKLGHAEFNYDVFSGRYSEINTLDIQNQPREPDKPYAGMAKNYNPNKTFEPEIKDEDLPF